MSNENKQSQENNDKIKELVREDLEQVVGGVGEIKEKKPFDKDRATRLPEI